MADWLTDALTGLGYFGIALAMLLENVFPPIPSEAVLPAAGIAARRGDLSAVGVIAAATAGSLGGALFWYGVGRRVGADRVRAWAGRGGRRFGLRRGDIDRATAWFDERGGYAVFLGRMIPGVRTLVSVPAGVSNMPLGRFALLTTAGSALWNTALTMLGWWLGKSSKSVERGIGVAGVVVLLLSVVWLVKRLRGRSRTRDDAAPAESGRSGSIDRS